MWGNSGKKILRPKDDALLQRVAHTKDEGMGLLAVGDPRLYVSAYSFLNEDFAPGDKKKQVHAADLRQGPVNHC